MHIIYIIMGENTLRPYSSTGEEGRGTAERRRGLLVPRGIIVDPLVLLVRTYEIYLIQVVGSSYIMINVNNLDRQP
jgi:hypothetical protein